MNTDGLNLDETLALTEKLQKAEARALEAESFITQIQEIANSSDGIVGYHLNGEILRWNEFDWPNENSITAAREVLRKAKDWDECEGEEALNACVGDAKLFDFKLNTLPKCIAELQRQRDTLRTERDELAALVEDFKKAVELAATSFENANWQRNHGKFVCGKCGGSHEDWDQIAHDKTCEAFVYQQLLTLAPCAALADLKSRVRREVLEAAAKHFDDCWSRVAAELRCMAEEGK